jgi:hypothetical protein
MRLPSIASICALVVLVSGCAPSSDVSGWEVAQKRGEAERMKTFPELPLVLPPTPEAPSAPPSNSAMQAVIASKLAEGSLFRRGYSAPTP